MCACFAVAYHPSHVTSESHKAHTLSEIIFRRKCSGFHIDNKLAAFKETYISRDYRPLSSLNPIDICHHSSPSIQFFSFLPHSNFFRPSTLHFSPAGYCLLNTSCQYAFHHVPPLTHFGPRDAGPLVDLPCPPRESRKSD